MGDFIIRFPTSSWHSGTFKDIDEFLNPVMNGQFFNVKE